MAERILIDLILLPQIHFEILHVHEIQSLTSVLNLRFFFTFSSGLLGHPLGLCGAEVLGLCSYHSPALVCVR